MSASHRVRGAAPQAGDYFDVNANDMVNVSVLENQQLPRGSSNRALDGYFLNIIRYTECFLGIFGEAAVRPSHAPCSPVVGRYRPLRDIEITVEGESDMAGNDSRRQPVTVVLPPEPPRLTPGAARALLRILVKAHEKQIQQQEEDACSGAPVPPGD